MPKRTSRIKAKPKTEVYKHPEAELLLRPEVGTQAQFRKKKLPKKYRYDDSLSPVMEWDGQNSARVMGEWLLAMIEQASRLEAPHTFSEPQQLKNSSGSVVASVTGLQDAVEQLKRIERPFLNWAGKAERLSFDVPTLPLFVHERLSTKAILETLKGHKRDRQFSMFDLFGTEEHSITDQVLRAYEHKDNWTNRMILGDSLVVMNSLLQYEGLGGQVQMIYMDPPYGIRFGSNFQPFIRKRDVKHNDDADMTREPEMVQAYRDTWEFGLHSYLSYMRDRLLLGRDLLHHSGSIFVQISDENQHHVRELMDEVFGSANFISLIAYMTAGGFTSSTLSRAGDYLLWYAKDKERIKYRELFKPKPSAIGESHSKYDQVELSDGTRRAMSSDEKSGETPLPKGSRIYRVDTIVSAGFRKNNPANGKSEAENAQSVEEQLRKHETEIQKKATTILTTFTSTGSKPSGTKTTVNVSHGTPALTPEQKRRGLAGEEEIKRRLQLPGGWEGFTLVKDRRDDGCGYDFLCDLSGQEVMLEVKTFLPTGRIFVSTPELQRAVTSGTSYYLVGVVYEGSPNEWATHLLCDPATTLLLKGEFDVQAQLKLQASELFG